LGRSNVRRRLKTYFKRNKVFLGVMIGGIPFWEKQAHREDLIKNSKM
jgi:hypothetical protein